MSNLAQLERCLKNIFFFVAVFDRQWCNSVVLEFLQILAMRLIPTGFPVTYLAMAISTFNRLVGEKYLPHLSAPTHPANLASVTNSGKPLSTQWSSHAATQSSSTSTTVSTDLTPGWVVFCCKADRNLLSTWDTVADTAPRSILKQPIRSADSERR